MRAAGTKTSHRSGEGTISPHTSHNLLFQTAFYNCSLKTHIKTKTTNLLASDVLFVKSCNKFDWINNAHFCWRVVKWHFLPVTWIDRRRFVLSPSHCHRVLFIRPIVFISICLLFASCGDKATKPAARRTAGPDVPVWWAFPPRSTNGFGPRHRPFHLLHLHDISIKIAYFRIILSLGFYQRFYSFFVAGEKEQPPLTPPHTKKTSTL